GAACITPGCQFRNRHLPIGTPGRQCCECRFAAEARMLTRVMVVVAAVAVASFGGLEAAQACPPPVHSDVNYAQGGATSGTGSFVVPNLPALGFFPAIAASSPTATSGMNQLAGGHNQVLAGVLAHFAAAHPDATVIPVDTWSVFLPLLGDARFTNVTQSCVDV